MAKAVGCHKSNGAAAGYTFTRFLPPLWFTFTLRKRKKTTLYSVSVAATPSILFETSFTINAV